MRIHNEVYEPLRRALKDHHELSNAPAEEVAHQLVSRGYLQEEPPVAFVAYALRIVEAEEQAFAPGISPVDL